MLRRGPVPNSAFSHMHSKGLLLRKKVDEKETEVFYIGSANFTGNSRNVCYDAVLKVRTTGFSEWGDGWKAYVHELAKKGVEVSDVAGGGVPQSVPP